MKFFFTILLFFFVSWLSSQNIPVNTLHNQNIEWENVYTEGAPGKVNRGIVDSDGNPVVIFMPDNESRVHKIDGNSGQIIWSITIDNTVGFGITEINDDNRCDYIISGGIGETQERWVSRVNGNNGGIMWNKTYGYSGSSWMYDGVRMTIVGDDGYIYGSGFVQGDEPNTIFVVYGGKGMIIKINPINGNEVWTSINEDVEYALSLVQASNNFLYYGSALYDENLSLSKLNTDGNIQWTNFIQNTENAILSDITIDINDNIYFGAHSSRTGIGDPFDYTCLKIDLNGNVEWNYSYANPRGYSLEYIRNELFGIKVNIDGVFLFGGTGDENDNYSQINPPFLSSDIWNGWVLQISENGDIIRSDVYSQADVNTATEYGFLIDGGYVIFNDTDAYGDTEVGVIKVIFSDLSNCVYGCTDINAINYNPLANTDDFSCEYFQNQDEGISISLNAGWNMIGFSCLNNINVYNSILPYYENIIIIKNNFGGAYLPDWNFNGIGNFERGFGYQIKLSNPISDFNLCNY